MSPTDLARKWVAARGVELLLTAVAVLLVAKTLLFLYEGVQTRLRFRKLKAQGIVSQSSTARVTTILCDRPYTRLCLDTTPINSALT